MTQLTVILENSAQCELARIVVDVAPSEDPDEATNLALHEAIESWTLSAGDVIRISR